MYNGANVSRPRITPQARGQLKISGGSSIPTPSPSPVLLSFPLPLFLPSLPFRSHFPVVWGSSVSPAHPAGSGAEPQPKLNLVHFSLKM